MEWIFIAMAGWNHGGVWYEWELAPEKPFNDLTSCLEYVYYMPKDSGERYWCLISKEAT